MHRRGRDRALGVTHLAFPERSGGSRRTEPLQESPLKSRMRRQGCPMGGVALKRLIQDATMVVLLVALTVPGVASGVPAESPRHAAAVLAVPVENIPITMTSSTPVVIEGEPIGSQVGSMAPLAGEVLVVADLAVLASFDGVSGSVTCYGILYNPTSHPVEAMTIGINLYDAQGADAGHFMVREAGQFGGLVLYPGDFVTFAVGCPMTRPAVRMTMKPLGTPCAKMPILTESSSGRPIASNTLRVCGVTMTNDTWYTPSKVVLGVIEWSKSTGHIIDTRHVHFSDETIPPGGMRSQNFDMEVPHSLSDIEYSGWSEIAKAPPSVTGSVRIAGADRYATSVAAAQSGFPEGSKTAVLVSGQSFPDALSASALAGFYEAPILLTKSSTLSVETRSELLALGVEHVVIIGSPAAVSTLVEASVSASLPSSATVERIGGSDRYATSAAVLREIYRLQGGLPVGSVFVTRGDQFPDALSGAPFAYSQVKPMLLVRPTALPAAVAAAASECGVSSAWILGGAPAVSDTVARALQVPYARIQGSDRYSTAAQLALTGLDEGWTDGANIGLATGLNFPDALAAGPALGARSGALLLTRPEYLSWPSGIAIQRAANRIKRVETYGGLPAVSATAAGTAHYLCF